MCADFVRPVSTSPTLDAAMAARMAAVARHLIHRCDGNFKESALPSPFDAIHDYAKRGHALIAEYRKTKDPAVAVSLGRLFEEYGIPSRQTTPPASQFEEAAFWYKVAAEAGNAEGQFALGALMKTGMASVGGTIEDGMGWIKKAADQGHPHAHLYLGHAHRAGIGVTKDAVEALACFQRALHADGAPLARHSLAEMLEAGEGIDVDIPRAVALYREAVEQGYRRSQFRLGCLHLAGLHVPKDLSLATELIRAAANQGYTPAVTKLREIDGGNRVGQPTPRRGLRALVARMLRR